MHARCALSADLTAVTLLTKIDVRRAHAEAEMTAEAIDGEAQCEF